MKKLFLMILLLGFSGCYTFIPFHGTARPDALPLMTENELISEYYDFHWMMQGDAGFKKVGKWEYIGKVVENLYKFHPEWEQAEHEKLTKNKKYFTRRIHSEWGDIVWNAIDSREVFIGMTKEQLEMSWGTPSDINRSVGSWGVHEQWIYARSSNRKYVYLENDIVTSFQD